MKNILAKQDGRPNRKPWALLAVVVLVIAALALWYKYSYRGLAELRLSTKEAQNASQELCGRYEPLRSVQMLYRWPCFLKVKCKCGPLAEADAEQVAQDVAALLSDEDFAASYASAYRKRYRHMEAYMEDTVINCAIVQFFQPGQLLPEHEVTISLFDGGYVISMSS